MTLNEYKEMIKASWTYAKFTENEKETWENIINSDRILKAINNGKFKKETIWNILSGVYYAYLLGLGYNNYNWRD